MKGFTPTLMDMCHNYLQDFQLASWCCSDPSGMKKKNSQSNNATRTKKKVMDDKKLTAQSTTDQTDFYGSIQSCVVVMCRQFATSPDMRIILSIFIIITVLCFSVAFLFPYFVKKCF